jgi:hypothetical protein
MLVGYDAHGEPRNYDKVIGYLKEFSWCHPLDSTWLIVTTKPLAVVRDEVKACLDANDSVMVIDVTGDNWGTVSVHPKANEWLHANLS